MNFTQLETITPALIKSGVSLEIKSSPGRGKSEYTASVPKRMSKILGKPFGFQTCFLATQTTTALTGFNIPEKFHERLLSVLTVPQWAQVDLEVAIGDMRFADEYEYGLLVLDEYGQGESDVKRQSAELLLNKRLGPHKLPKGWCVWALSNFASDRSGVTKSFDFVINRRGEIIMTDDLASWERWALSHGVGPIFIHFAKQNPQIVFSGGVPEKQGPWCTPRSLVLCERMLMGLADDRGMIPMDPEANELASGMIGPAAASQLFATIQLAHVMPDYNDIINDPKNTKIPDRPDARMLVCYQLAHRVTEKTMSPVITYMERMPKEFAITFAKSAARRDDSLIDTAAFSKFCVDNQSLLGTIARAKL